VTLEIELVASPQATRQTRKLPLPTLLVYALDMLEALADPPSKGPWTSAMAPNAELAARQNKTSNFFIYLMS